MHRRDALLSMGYLLCCTSLPNDKKRRPPGTVLRLAHITDVHLNSGCVSTNGFVRCLKEVNACQPDLILNGGDSIGDSWSCSKQEAEDQWSHWNKVLKDNCSLPIRHCLGNHDVWNAWNAKDKQLAMDHLGLAKRYYSFNKSGWHFVVLDNVVLEKDFYKGGLDEEQFDWLKADLKKNRKPTLVLSHIPILAACVFFDGDNEESGKWEIPVGWMNLDARKVKDLFCQNKNVRLCLSGHIHLKDRVEYNGTTYICDGAVCGKWWDGSYQETPPGYSIIDLQADGNFIWQYVPWGI